MKATMSPRRKAQAEEVPSGYRVGSVSKTGHILWAYDECLTLPEAETLAASSRLSILAPGVKALKTLPLPPRASQRLAKFRRDGEGVPVACDVYIVLASGRVLKATESKGEADIYQKTYNEYHSSSGKRATIRKVPVTV